MITRLFVKKVDQFVWLAVAAVLADMQRWNVNFVVNYNFLVKKLTFSKTVKKTLKLFLHLAVVKIKIKVSETQAIMQKKARLATYWTKFYGLKSKVG